MKSISKKEAERLPKDSFLGVCFLQRVEIPKDPPESSERIKMIEAIFQVTPDALFVVLTDKEMAEHLKKNVFGSCDLISRAHARGLKLVPPSKQLITPEE